MHVQILRRILWPLLLGLFLLIPAVYLYDFPSDLQLSSVGRAVEFFRYFVSIGLWINAAWLANELIEVLVWQRLARSGDGGVPSLLKHIVSLGIF